MLITSVENTANEQALFSLVPALMQFACAP